MAKINEHALNFMAKEIAIKMDAKDGKSDKKISASIWNQFVNGKLNENGPQVGNGEKSQIKYSISLEKAVKSIKSYIMKKGTNLIKNVLKEQGIDIKTDLCVKPGDELEKLGNYRTNARKDSRGDKYLQNKGYEFTFEQLDNAFGRMDYYPKDYNISDADKKRVLNKKGKHGYNYVEALYIYMINCFEKPTKHMKRNLEQSITSAVEITGRNFV